MDDTSSNATSVGVRLIRRRSQFSRRRLLSKNAAPFIHCLYLIYARKFDVRSHGKITQHWIWTLTPITTNRPGLAEMRGPVLWLQHTSSSPDTSTRHPYEPTMLQGPLASSGEYKTKVKTTKTLTVQKFSLTVSVSSVKTTYKRTQPMFGVVASVLAVVCSRMQQLSAVLGQLNTYTKSKSPCQ